MGNTGRKIYPWLIQVDDSGNPTGLRKPNIPGDPDYIPPVADYVSCPLPTTTTTSSTTTTTTTLGGGSTSTTTSTSSSSTTTTTTAAPTSTTTTTTTPTTLFEISNQKIVGSLQTITDVQIAGATLNPLTSGSFPIIAGQSGAETRPEYGFTYNVEVFYNNVIAGADTVSILDSHAILQTYSIAASGSGSHVFTGVQVIGGNVIIRLF